MLAKLEMAILNKFKLNENCYDFFGTEKDCFLEHILHLSEFSYMSTYSSIFT